MNNYEEITAPPSPPTTPDKTTKKELEQQKREQQHKPAHALNIVRESNEAHLRQDITDLKNQVDSERELRHDAENKYHNLRESYGRLDERYRHTKLQRTMSTIMSALGGLFLAISSVVGNKDGDVLAIVGTVAGVALIVVSVVLEICGAFSEKVAESRIASSTTGR